MSDWPLNSRVSPVVISTAGPMLLAARQLGGAAPISGDWPTANKAFYVPFEVDSPTLAAKLFVINGGTVAGNIDMGIYDEDGNKLVSTGTTVQAGVSTAQAFDITDTVLPRGRFYFGLAKNDVTGTVMRVDLSGNPWQNKPLGIFMQATAFVLPATATFATADWGLPIMGLTGKTVI